MNTDFKTRLWKLADVLVIVYMGLETTLAGGAHYLAETGINLHGFVWEELPSIGLGLVSPLCAALVAFKLLSSWNEFSSALRRLLTAIYIFWLVSWVPFIAGYFLAHSSDLTYLDMHKLYFPNHWRLTNVLGMLDIVAANTIMFPAMLAVMWGQGQIDAQQQLATEQAEAQAAKKSILLTAGQIPSQMLGLLKTHGGMTIKALQAAMDTDVQLQPHLTKLLDMDPSPIYRYRGSGKEYIYELNPD